MDKSDSVSGFPKKEAFEHGKSKCLTGSSDSSSISNSGSNSESESGSDLGSITDSKSVIDLGSISCSKNYSNTGSISDSFPSNDSQSDCESVSNASVSSSDNSETDEDYVDSADDSDTDSLVGEEKSVYTQYTPAFTGGGKHPDPLCESTALSPILLDPIIKVPQSDFSVWFGKKAAVSNAQIQAVMLMEKAHARHFLLEPDLDVRLGFINGDGPGVGKSRELCFGIKENEACGRFKHVWVTSSAGLIDGLKTELKAVKSSLEVIDVSSKEPTETILNQRGVAVLTYHLLSGGVVSAKTKVNGEPSTPRYKQLYEWMTRNGKFDGLLILDECHSAKSFFKESGKVSAKRGYQRGSRTHHAVVKLQYDHPDGRIVYSSATCASEIEHYGYMVRLSLWGPEKKYLSAMDFIQEMKKRGRAAVELLTMTLKQKGLLIARTLSFKGVKVTPRKVPLDASFEDLWKRSSHLWIQMLQTLQAKFAKGGSLEGEDRKGIMSKFWAACQRYFKTLIYSSKIVEGAAIGRKFVAEGFAVVYGIQGTGESGYKQEPVPDKSGAFSLSRHELKQGFAAMGIFIEDSREGKNYKVNDESESESDYDSKNTSDDESESESDYDSENVSDDESGNESDDESGNESDEESENGSDKETSDESDDESSGASMEETSEDSSLESNEDHFEKRPVKRRRIINSDSEESTNCPNYPDGTLGWSRGLKVDETHPEKADYRSDPDEYLIRLFYDIENWLPVNPLDQLIRLLGGPEKVAEMTGRDEGNKYLGGAPGTKVWKSYYRPKDSNKKELDKFQDGKKLFAVISDCASTGLSMHSDKNNPIEGQRTRKHIQLEYPWSPDKTLQQMGRTNRSNQAKPAEYELLQSVVPCEVRFEAVVASRLKNLGASCHADGDANPLFGSISDRNYELCGAEALKKLKVMIQKEKSPQYVELFKKLYMVGFLKERKGKLTITSTEVKKLLNRALVLPLNDQEKVVQLLDMLIARVVRERQKKFKREFTIFAFHSKFCVTELELLKFTKDASTIFLGKYNISRMASWKSILPYVKNYKGTPLWFTQHYKNNGKTVSEIACAFQFTNGYRIFYPWNRVLTEQEAGFFRLWNQVNCLDEAKRIWSEQYEGMKNVPCIHVYRFGECEHKGCREDWGRLTRNVLHGDILDMWTEVERKGGDEKPKIVKFHVFHGIGKPKTFVYGIEIPPNRVAFMKFIFRDWESEVIAKLPSNQ